MAKTHIVKLGDLLYLLSQKYYGTPSKWQKIVNANGFLKGRGKAIDGSPLIFPLDILIIPDDIPQKPAQNINANSENDITIKIDGQRFAFFNEVSLTQEIDSFDVFNFSAPFKSDEFIYREAFRPFGYKNVQVYYGSNLFLDGTLLAPQSQSSPDIAPVSLTGYAKCGVLSKSNLSITRFPIEFNNQNLQQITNSMISDFGISATFESAAGNIFKKVTPEPEQKILDFLINLAQQRGLLISNTIEGNLLFWKTRTGIITSTFREGETPFISCIPNFDPDDFYSEITGIMPAKSGVASQKFTVVNNYMQSRGINRPYNFIISDAEQSDLQNAVKTKAGFMFANAISYQLKVFGHRNRNNQLYQKNTLISVLAPNAMIFRDTTFLIKKVTLNRTEQGGDTTILDLVLPESYSGQIPAIMPFEE